MGNMTGMLRLEYVVESSLFAKKDYMVLIHLVPENVDYKKGHIFMPRVGWC